MRHIFEPERAILLDSPEVPPFNVENYLSLEEALLQHKLHPDEQVLLAAIGGEMLVLPMLSMVFHHVAQGQLAGVDWMATYCCLCNGGRVFDAQHQTGRYTFSAQGYYDMMVLLADEQTQSFWNHLTGECLYGALAGASLTPLETLAQMRVADVRQSYPSARVAAITLSADELATAKRWDSQYRVPAEPVFEDELLATASKADSRLSRYDMGLGIWTPHTQRYYSITQIYAQQNVITDTLDGRGVVITLNPAVGLPFAFYYEPDAKPALKSGRLNLAPNTFYRDNFLYVDGRKVAPEKPHHVAIRWYGFSSIFPNCEIYKP